MGTFAKSILCIDDDSAILRLHKRLMEDAGYSVLTAAPCAEALSMLAEGLQAEVAVLDYLMPGMDGEKLAVKLRTRYPKLRLVAVCANKLPPAMPDAVDNHMSYGYFTNLTPVSPSPRTALNFRRTSFSLHAI